MRPARVAAKIGPISRRRVDRTRSPPNDRLAASGNNGPYALCHRVVGIGVAEGLVAFQRVAFERGDISVLRAEIADRPGASGGYLIGRNQRRRRVGRSFEEDKI